MWFRYGFRGGYVGCGIDLIRGGWYYGYEFCVYDSVLFYIGNDFSDIFNFDCFGVCVGFIVFSYIKFYFGFSFIF